MDSMIKAQHSDNKGLLERTYRETTSAVRTRTGKDSMVRKGSYIKDSLDLFRKTLHN
jgi:hypothetical protein